jgi:hypothetical protein
LLFRLDLHPKVYATAYALDPVRTGTARKPLPMSPSASKTAAASPASGRSASAACAADVICVWPAWNNVAPVARMMKYIIAFEKNMPMRVSHLAAFNSALVT